MQQHQSGGVDRQKLTINHPLGDDGKITSITPLQGLMAMGEKRGFDVEINLQKPFEELQDEEMSVEALLGKVVLGHLTHDQEIRPMEYDWFPNDVRQELVKILRGFGYLWDEDEDDASDDEDLLSECNKLSKASDDNVVPLPSIVELAKDEDGNPIRFDFTQKEYAEKAYTMKHPPFEDEGDNVEEEDEDVPFDTGTEVPSISIPHGVKLNNCMTTKQVGRYLFGSAHRHVVKPLYNTSYRKLLGAFQCGPDNGKKCKLYWPRENVVAYKERLLSPLN
jgi:hypothetical protein